jgi:hypothetical protein
VAGVNGYNHGGVEWMVTGGNVGLVCGEKISGGARFCTENAGVLCTVKTHLVSKAKLKLEWLYTKTTDTCAHHKAASLAWECQSTSLADKDRNWAAPC